MSKPNPTTSGKPCHAPAGVPQQTKRNSAKVCIGTNAQRPPACVSPSMRVLFKVPAAPHVHDQAAFGWLPRSHVLVSPLPKKPNRKASEDRGVPTPRKRSSARCETTKHHTTGGRRFSFCPLLPSAGSSTPEGAPPTGVQSNVRGPRLGNRNPERPVSVLPATANVAYRAGWHCKQAANASQKKQKGS